ncbi:hypothetical protein BMI91_19500 [Thioclava sediminum]|uniref:Uncharacterized protein n=1 Tax=Thioclava sediminum TaxID=1915319 RepID=A0ABX3MRZ9_9RHOB|nr:hypothetical protein [Thioclava sediminum]OOY22469.1 hypothetical protein BMI91_19500 [Thioclava sediminum]
MKDIDITRAIRAKSDQLNADDLLAGPMTIKIRDIQVVAGEQPVSVYFDGDDGKPWKPSKSALRVLAAIWGANAAKWLGMSCTLFNDESVTWAGVAVGGIRVSHMEGLSKPREIKLTKTRGKKVGVTIQPLLLEKHSQADKWKERLFAVAEDPEKSVEDAWGKVPAEIKAELADDIYDKLIAMQEAATLERESDPDATANALNDAIG